MVRSTWVRQTSIQHIRSWSPHAHFHHLRHDARDGETHKSAQDGIVDVPSGFVDQRSDSDDKDERDNDTDDEEKVWGNRFGVGKRALDRDVRERKLSFVTTNFSKKRENEPVE